MAAGTSSPELFTALVALVTPSAQGEGDDLGVGTIVGSGEGSAEGKGDAVLVAKCLIVFFPSHLQSARDRWP